MWDGLALLLFLSASLALASYVAGAVPLAFSLGRRSMRLLTACGTGILVGTSLIVIIPEGVETLYSANAVGASASHRLSLRDDTADGAHGLEPHAWVGLSIIAGFILMYLVDTLPKVVSNSSRLRPAYISLQGMGLNSAQRQADEEAEEPTQRGTGPEGFRPTSTTTGLVIHAAADGIALGASTTSGTQGLGLIVFFALMIHKAPAAFGLTTVLLKQGLSKRQAKLHLVVFSLAAPVGALSTWSVAQVVAGGSFGGEAQTAFVTGLLLLFSGGTFLYVAMHSMQDSGHGEQGDDPAENGYADIYQRQRPRASDDDGRGRGRGPTALETAVTAGGMLLPLLTQVSHEH